jgi:hypothetical protein
MIVKGTEYSARSSSRKGKGPYGPDGKNHPPPVDRIIIRVGRRIAEVKKILQEKGIPESEKRGFSVPKR